MFGIRQVNKNGRQKPRTAENKISLLAASWGKSLLESWGTTATINLCRIYFKITLALAILLEHMHKKFEINRTKLNGGCQLGRKVVTHNSKSDLALV